MLGVSITNFVVPWRDRLFLKTTKRRCRFINRNYDLRIDKGVAGDFYTTGECLACELPEMEAPKLLAELTDENYDTYFVRQPESTDEIAQAIAAANSCCVDAVRYSGKDKNIIRRLNPGVSDFKIGIFGNVVPANCPWWKLW